MPTRDQLRAASRRAAAKRNQGPLWAGPGGPGSQGGVTNSLLARYLACGERYRVHAVLGLRPAEQFNARIEFGNMWHACEEALAGGDDPIGPALEKVLTSLDRQYQTDREEIGLWGSKCFALFGRYVDHWAKHPDVANRTPLLQEEKFDVPYRLSSGRTVRLRGKWDAVDLISKTLAGAKGGVGSIWLQENKTKSSIDSVALARQLTFDLQTMLYLIALTDKHARMGWASKGPIAGVRYNVVRRPAHKSVESMLKKVDEDARNNRAGEWFTRFEVHVSPADVATFRRQCLDPVLENLCDDWEWWEMCLKEKQDPYTYGVRQDLFPEHRRRHFRTPYFYNPLTEGGSGDVDEYLNTGSEAGLRRADDLFPELKETTCPPS